MIRAGAAAPRLVIVKLRVEPSRRSAPAERARGSASATPSDGVRTERGEARPYLQHRREHVCASWRRRAGEQGLPDHPCRIDLDRRVPHGWSGERARYRRTVHYAYHCRTTACCRCTSSPAELARTGTETRRQGRARQRPRRAGCLLMGHARGGYWYGRADARRGAGACPHNSATAAGRGRRLAGCIWAIRHPERDVIDRQLPTTRSWRWPGLLGGLVGVYTDLTARRPRLALQRAARSRRSLAVRQLPRRLSGCAQAPRPRAR